MANLLIAVAEILITLSYLFNSLLILRYLSAIGMILYVISTLIVGLDKEGMFAIFISSVIIAVINLVKIFRILKDNLSIFLPEEVRKIYEECFSSLSNSEFIQLYKVAKLQDFSHGETILDKGVQNTHLIFIIDGKAMINLNPELTIEHGSFIGEMSYISGNLTSASVQAFSDKVHCLIWKKSDLQKFENSLSEIYQKFFRIIAVDLVNKLVKNPL